VRSEGAGHHNVGGDQSGVEQEHSGRAEDLPDRDRRAAVLNALLHLQNAPLGPQNVSAGSPNDGQLQRCARHVAHSESPHADEPPEQKRGDDGATVETRLVKRGHGEPALGVEQRGIKRRAAGKQRSRRRKAQQHYRLAMLVRRETGAEKRNDRRSE